MRLSSLIFVFLFSLVGCSRTVIRDAKVYKEELNFFDASSEEVVKNAKVVISNSCQCMEQEGVMVFTTEACSNLADTVLVMDSRVKYHTDMMRFNAGLTETRPPKDPPVIPEANSLCPDGE